MNQAILAGILASTNNQTESVIRLEIIFVVLLSVAALVAYFSRRLRHLPYTVALVIAGGALTFISGETISFGADFGDIILLLLVPPLVFEATLHIKWEALRRDLLPILLLALVGSLVGAFLVAWPVSYLLGFTPLAAFAFGALISATDPVAVISFFRGLGVSQRLALLVEGESLFNDGVAIVLFTVALGVGEAMLNGGDETVHLNQALLQFIRVAGGGLLIGSASGYIVSTIILKQVDDHLIETATTVALAFGSFVVAEQLHLSGILAVVAAGIFVGNIGSQNTSPTTQIALNNFWEFLAFTANSIVFLLIGLQTHIDDMVQIAAKIGVAIVAVLVSRAIVVYGLTALNNRFNRTGRIPIHFRHVMFWGGLRGAISLALAVKLAESPNIFGRSVTNDIVLMTFGVVLFTLLAQATTLTSLLRRLGLTRKPTHVMEKERQQGQLLAKRAGKATLDKLYHEGGLAREIWQAMAAVYDEEIVHASRDLISHLQNYAELKQQMVMQARQETLKAERSALAEALRRGLIGEEVYQELVEHTDNRAAALTILRQSQEETDEGRPSTKGMTP